MLIIGYDGKTLCQFNKSQSIQPKLFNTDNICAPSDTLATMDVLDNQCIQYLIHTQKHRWQVQ